MFQSKQQLRRNCMRNIYGPQGGIVLGKPLIRFKKHNPSNTATLLPVLFRYYYRSIL